MTAKHFEGIHGLGLGASADDITNMFADRQVIDKVNPSTLIEVTRHIGLPSITGG